ncbi:MAG: hypothetical protein ACREXX_00500 [Gammaproteobacteria bacterium]
MAICLGGHRAVAERAAGADRLVDHGADEREFVADVSDFRQQRAVLAEPSRPNEVLGKATSAHTESARAIRELSRCDDNWPAAPSTPGWRLGSHSVARLERCCREGSRA